jgi:FAD synthase
MRVEFSDFLRGQERFESADELIAQMGEDVRRARQVLAGHPRDRQAR